MTPLAAIDGLDAVRHQLNGLVAFRRLGREEDAQWRADGVEALLYSLEAQVKAAKDALHADHKKNLAQPLTKRL
jgi:hypothetical protein